MPLGGHRKPFSNKQKKEQLQAKRERKRNKKNDDDDDSSSDNNQPSSKSDPPKSTSDISESTSINRNAQAAKNVSLKLINQQPRSSQQQPKEHNPNRFNLIFLKESPEELKLHKKNASKALQYRSEQDLEVDIEEVYKPSSPLDIPIRPKWSYEMTKEQLEEHERKYFATYLNTVFENFKGNHLSYFEMNLETWRQLWRVVEISDIILLIVDIRFPVLHFSPAFYDYCRKLEKDVILILNKIDLVETSVVIAWKHYFERTFPNLNIIMFSSSKQIKFRKQKRQARDILGNEPSLEELEIKALAANIYTARAHRQLYECVRNIVKDRVDLSSWSNFTEELLKKSTTTSIESTSLRMLDKLTLTNQETDEMHELISNTRLKRKKFSNNFITIGCCGFPNVGKSSLLNSLNGKKVVSVSRTPGHTKHLQTIFLTKTVRLCDCPGLVFPSLVSKPLQILAGIYPIAQLQEPYSSIRYLAERIPVAEILKIKHPNDTNLNKVGKEDMVPSEWSPLDICEAWALKRGYFTAKASRPDVYRAANELLRMALDGRLCLSLKPRNYFNEKKYWNEHAENEKLNEIAKSVEAIAKENRPYFKFTEEEEEEESDDEFDDRPNFESNEEKETMAESDSEKKGEHDHDDDEDVCFSARKNPYAMLNAEEN